MLNLLDMSGKTILVTGASSGIGRSTAILLSQLGARLVLVARNTSALEQTRTQLQPTQQHHILPCDLADIDQIPVLFNSIQLQIGACHGLVHAAGVDLLKPLRFLKNEELQKILDVNVLSAFALAKAFRQKDNHQPNSAIVFISSIVGLIGQAGISAYSASKGAVIALTKSLAVELAHDGIRVNNIAPGVVKTAMTDQVFSMLSDERKQEIEKRHLLGFGSPEDVANASAFLLSDASRWITGSTLIVDGGYTAN